MSRQTGFARDYTHLPYEEYLATDVKYFPVKFRTDISAQRFTARDHVAVVYAHGNAKAYSAEEVARVDCEFGSVEDLWNGLRLQVDVTMHQLFGRLVNVRATDERPAVAYVFGFVGNNLPPEVLLYHGPVQAPPKPLEVSQY